MKTKEQKRREAYDRLVKHAQMTYRALLSFEKSFPNRNKQLFVDDAKDASTKVWEFHHKYGYPLPDFKTFYNR